MNETRTNPAPPMIYGTLRRWAPVLIVLFCIGFLVTMAFVSPFQRPASGIVLESPLIGSGVEPNGGYVVIRNTGGSDTLIGASSPAATTVTIEQRVADESDPAGVLVAVDRLPIPGFDSLRLQPGQDQLRLTGLSGALAPGTRIPLTLEFERAGTITVDAEVQTYDDIAARLLPPRVRIAGQG